jgi:hypothetical protein
MEEWINSLCYVEQTNHDVAAFYWTSLFHWKRISSLKRKNRIHC